MQFTIICNILIIKSSSAPSQEKHLNTSYITCVKHLCLFIILQVCSPSFLSPLHLSVCLSAVCLSGGLRFPIVPPLGSHSSLHRAERAPVTRPPLSPELGAAATHGFPHFCMQPAQLRTQ